MNENRFAVVACVGVLCLVIGVGLAGMATGTAAHALAVAPTPTATPDVVQMARTPVESNADWTPVVQEFGGVEMVLVPAGCFMMGSTEEQIDAALTLCDEEVRDCKRSWFADESPAHRVCFEEPYWIGRFEVTTAQYQACVEAGACDLPATSYEAYYAPFTGEGYPVAGVSWEHAQQYISWLNETVGGDFQLPTEAQWEYAARGPDGLLYPWGNTFEAQNVVHSSNADGHMQPVGSRSGGTSWVGALDMSGNVSEWVADWYDADYYATLPDGVVNPQGPAERVGCNCSATRGGSWSHDGFYLRAVHRSYTGHFAEWPYLGFRVARPASR